MANNIISNEIFSARLLISNLGKMFRCYECGERMVQVALISISDASCANHAIKAIMKVAIGD